MKLIAATLGVTESWLSGGDTFDRFEIPPDLTHVWNRILQLRAVVEEGFIPDNWSVDMERVMQRTGYHPDLDEDEKRRLKQTPDTFLNVRIDPEIRDRIHEVAALTSLPIQEMVRLSWCVFEDALSSSE